MKNHKWVEGRLLQTNKRYAHQNLRKRLQREQNQQMTAPLMLEPLPVSLSVCKVEDFSQALSSLKNAGYVIKQRDS